MSHIVFRHVQAGDVEDMLRLVSLSTIPGIENFADIPSLWRDWLGCGAMRGSVIEHHGAEGTTIEGFGVAVFLKELFWNEYRKSPRGFLADTIYRLSRCGDSPLLNRNEIAATNWSRGLNLFILHYCQRPPSQSVVPYQDVLTVAHSAFRDTTEGYNLNVLCQEAFSPHQQEFLASGGMRLIHDFSHGTHDYCLMGLTREDAERELPGTTVSFSFRTRPPVFFFTYTQQTILELAMRGESDADIAQNLQISKDSVKQTWRAIYERVDSDTLFQADNTESLSNHRRRKILLDYLRTHPEELRPVKRPRR